MLLFSFWLLKNVTFTFSIYLTISRGQKLFVVTGKAKSGLHWMIMILYISLQESTNLQLQVLITVDFPPLLMITSGFILLDFNKRKSIRIQQDHTNPKTCCFYKQIKRTNINLIKMKKLIDTN